LLPQTQAPPAQAYTVVVCSRHCCCCFLFCSPSVLQCSSIAESTHVDALASAASLNYILDLEPRGLEHNYQLQITINEHHTNKRSNNYSDKKTQQTPSNKKHSNKHNNKHQISRMCYILVNCIVFRSCVRLSRRCQNVIMGLHSAQNLALLIRSTTVPGTCVTVIVVVAVIVVVVPVVVVVVFEFACSLVCLLACSCVCVCVCYPLVVACRSLLGDLRLVGVM
jgi:hypothetical protein